MDSTNRTRLSAMMALLYAVQGAWWPLLALHLADLGLDGRRRGLVFATYPLATVAMALGAGAIVDRFLPAQRYLSACFAAGALLLLGFASGPAPAFGGLWAGFFLYWLITAPSYGIANAIAFRNLARPSAEFGPVRLWGTVGWMIVGWAVSAAMLGHGSSQRGDGAYEGFGVAAALSGCLAAYALRLPHTPPLASGARTTSLGAALRLARTPSVGVYLAVAFGVSITTPFVYQAMPPFLEAKGLPRAWASMAQTLGQFPEIVALSGLPWMLRRFGTKSTLGIGIGAWLVRFASLACDPPLWVAVVGIPLHGVGIACFTIGGQVYLDGRAPGDRRAGAQAMNMLITTGLGGLVGSLLAGDLAARFGGNSATVFLVPCLIHLGLIGFFIMTFRPDAGSTRAAGTCLRDVRPVPRDEPVRAVGGKGRLAMESTDG